MATSQKLSITQTQNPNRTFIRLWFALWRSSCGSFATPIAIGVDFDRLQLKVVQGKGKKDRYVPLSKHLIRGLKTYIEAEKPKTYLFNGQPVGRSGDDTSSSLSTCFDSRYSARGVQWAVKQACKAAGITKDVCVHTLRHTFATHLLEDGLDIISLKNLLGHEDIETTMLYLQIAQLDTQKAFSPLDTLFEKCGSNGGSH